MGYEFGLLDSRTAFDCNSEFVGACVTLGPSPRDQTFLQEPLDQSANCGTIDPCTLHEVGLTQSFVLSDALEYSKLPRRDVEVAGLNMEQLVRALARAVKNVEGARPPAKPTFGQLGTTPHWELGDGVSRVCLLVGTHRSLYGPPQRVGIPVLGETSRARGSSPRHPHVCSCPRAEICGDPVDDRF